MVSVWCGANRYEHLEVSRLNDVFCRICGAVHNSHQSTGVQYVKPLFFNQMKLDNYTFDVESTVLTPYGTQQGAKKKYNPKKPGRNSHHPLMAFVDEGKMIANFWLRRANTDTTNNLLTFLQDNMHRLEGKKVSRLSADSGFFGKEVFEFLKQQFIKYIIVARHYGTIQRKVAGLNNWWLLEDGLQITETTYQSHTWQKPRRLVVAGQEIKKRPKATGKHLKLIKEEGVYQNYRYSCYITHLDLLAHMVWKI